MDNIGKYFGRDKIEIVYELVIGEEDKEKVKDNFEIFSLCIWVNVYII